MIEDISFGQMMIDAVACRIEVQFVQTVFENSAPAMAVRAEWLDPKTDRRYRKQLVLDIAYFITAVQPDEFLRVRVGSCIAEMLYMMNGVVKIDDEIRRRWEL